MKIQVFIKNVYSKYFFYPKCKIAKSFSDIAKTKTLSIETLNTITSMGYDVQLENEIDIKDLLK